MASGVFRHQGEDAADNRLAHSGRCRSRRIHTQELGDIATREAAHIAPHSVIIQSAMWVNPRNDRTGSVMIVMAMISWRYFGEIADRSSSLQSGQIPTTPPKIPRPQGRPGKNESWRRCSIVCCIRRSPHQPQHWLARVRCRAAVALQRSASWRRASPLSETQGVGEIFGRDRNEAFGRLSFQERHANFRPECISEQTGVLVV